MAHGFTNSRKAAMLNAFLDNATLFLGVSDQDPLEDGSGISEPADGNYARQQITGTTPDWHPATVADPSIKSNNSTITFPQAGADWYAGVSFSWVFLADALTLGNIEWRGQLRDPRIILNTDTLRFDENELDVMLGDNDTNFV